MSTAKKFEDLLIWQRARLLCKKIYPLITQGTFEKDFALRDQINRSSGSVMDNIAEGFEREGNKEFAQFLSIAKASGGEVRSQLARAFDRAHISEDEFVLLTNETIELCRMISGLMKHLRTSEFSGSKYKRGDQGQL